MAETEKKAGNRYGWKLTTEGLAALETFLTGGERLSEEKLGEITGTSLDTVRRIRQKSKQNLTVSEATLRNFCRNLGFDLKPEYMTNGEETPAMHVSSFLAFAELCAQYKDVLEPYLKFLIDSNSTLDPRGMGKDLRHGALPLDEVYVSLAVERQQVRLVLASDTRDEDEGPERRAEQRQELSLDAAVLGFPRQVIVGDPGSGKTTLLRLLARRFAEATRDQAARVSDREKRDYGITRLPIFVRISRYAEALTDNKTLSLRDYLPEAFAELGKAKVKALAECFEAFLAAGFGLVLFDGLDEVTDAGDRGRIAGALDTFAHMAGGNQVVVTSRVAGYRMTPLGEVFSEFRLLDMSREQIAQFLERYCPAYERAMNPNHTPEQIEAAARAAQAAVLTAQERSLGVRRLTRNPLLLTVLVLVQRSKAQLPHYRIELYRLASEILLEDWRRHVVGTDECISETDALALLGPIALWMHQEHPSGMAPLDEIERRFTVLLAQDRGTTPQDTRVKKDVKNFIRRAREHTGLFVEKAPGQYGFLHFTFEEYFVARQLVTQYKELPFFIHRHRHLPRWEEPIRLAISYESRSSAERATALIQDAILCQSPKFPPDQDESILHRDLLMAALCLGDCLQAKSSLHQHISEQLSTHLLESARKHLPEFGKHLANRVAYLQSIKESQSTTALGERLLDALKNEDNDVRQAAAQALRTAEPHDDKTNDKDIEAVINALKDGYTNVRQAAAQVLGTRTNLNDKAIEALINALKDEYTNVRRAAAQALGTQINLNDKAIEALINALKDYDPHIRQAAAQVLGTRTNLNDKATEELLNALKDEYPYVRAEAAQALGTRTNLNDKAIEALINALKDRSSDVRRAAAQALGTQTNLGDRVIETLLNALKDGGSNVRQAAAQALGTRTNLNDKAIEALINTLKDGDSNVRQVAAQALGTQTNLGDKAIEALINALKDEQRSVRQAAAQALGTRTNLNDKAIEALLNALKDRDTDVRAEAAQALGTRTNLNDKAIEALLNALKDEYTNVRRAAAQALGTQINLNDKAIEALLNALKNRNSNVRQAAAQALGRLLGQKNNGLKVEQVKAIAIEIRHLLAIDQVSDVQDAAWDAWIQIR